MAHYWCCTYLFQTLTLFSFLSICYTISIGGANMFPPIVMEMQTGSTNKHISQIFFPLAAPMYWWVPILVVRYKG
jgi:hypothetical protein